MTAIVNASAIASLITASNQLNAAVLALTAGCENEALMHLRSCYRSMDVGYEQVRTPKNVHLLQPVLSDGEPDPEDYIPPEVPQGFDTVLGYLSRNNPEALSLMHDPVDQTKRDDSALVAQALVMGFPVETVQPSPGELRAGVAQARAYPNGVLEKRLG